MQRTFTRISKHNHILPYEAKVRNTFKVDPFKALRVRRSNRTSTFAPLPTTSIGDDSVPRVSSVVPPRPAIAAECLGDAAYARECQRNEQLRAKGLRANVEGRDWDDDDYAEDQHNVRTATSLAGYESDPPADEILIGSGMFSASPDDWAARRGPPVRTNYQGSGAMGRYALELPQIITIDGHKKLEIAMGLLMGQFCSGYADVRRFFGANWRTAMPPPDSRQSLIGPAEPGVDPEMPELEEFVLRWVRGGPSCGVGRQRSDYGGAYPTAFTVAIVHKTGDREVDQFRQELRRMFVFVGVLLFKILAGALPEVAANMVRQIHPSLYLSSVLRVDEVTGSGPKLICPLSKLDCLKSPLRSSLGYHRDRRVEIDPEGNVFPQATGAIQAPNTVGGTVLVDTSWHVGGKRETEGARIVELRPAGMGGAHVHITPTAALFHRSRMIREGWRFICCLYVPKGIIAYSAELELVTPMAGKSAFWTNYYRNGGR